jgi:uncharacterized protein (TIGR00369 family)
MTEKLTLEAIQAILDGSPYIAFHGLRCEGVDAAAQTVRLRMPLRAELERGKGTGQFHGGAIATLIDVTGDMGVAMLVGGGVPTINLRIDYLRPASGNALLAEARVRRAGRTIGVVDVDVMDEQGRLVAVGRGSYSTIVG